MEETISIDDKKILLDYGKHETDYNAMVNNGKKDTNNEYISLFKNDMLSCIKMFEKYKLQTNKELILKIIICSMRMYTDLFTNQISDQYGFPLPIEGYEDDLLEIMDILDKNIERIILFSDEIKSRPISDEHIREINSVIGGVIYNYAIYYGIIEENEKMDELLELSMSKYDFYKSRASLITMYSASPRVANIDKAIELLDGFKDIIIENNKWGYAKFNAIHFAYYCVCQSLINKGNYSLCLRIIDNYYTNFSHIDKNSFREEQKICKSKIDEINNPLLNDSIIQQVGFSIELLDKLDKTVKVYIQTSLKLFNVIERDNDITFDYSSVNITLSKAVEYLLYKLISNFLIYIKENSSKYKKVKYDNKIEKTIVYYDINKNLFNSHNYNKGIVSGLEETFDIGTALYSIVTEKGVASKHIRTSFRDYCDINKFIHTGKIFDDLIDRLFKMHDQRNLCAHRNRVVISNAKECRNILFEGLNVIKALYDCFGPVFK